MSYKSLKNIAEIAGVSLSTVSRVLNNKPDVNEKTREKVMKVVKELGYVPNKSALSFKTQKTHIIGAIVEDNTNPFWAEVLKGVEDTAKLYNYHVIFVNTSRSYQNEVEGIRTLLERRVDGILIAPNQEKYDDLLELKKLGIPFVIMGRHTEELGVPMVYNDDVKGGYDATRHLIERGCKRICYVGAQSYNMASIERYEGYKKALKESGMKNDKELIKTGGIEIEGGYESTMELIRDGVDFDGLFVYNDLMAIGVLKVLKEKGIGVPEKVRVIGYDDIPYSAAITPSLTTMRMKKKLIGETAFKLLLEPEERVVLNTDLIEREST